MKKTTKIKNPDSRRQYILDYMMKNKAADISQLSKLFDVSEMTVRRDLNILEKSDQLLRVHGGARIMPKEMHEKPLTKRMAEHSKAKMLIGRYAAGLVEEGDVIALDASSTAYAMCHFLEVSIVVITSNLSIALVMAEKPNIEVILLGGKLRKSSLSTVGSDLSYMMEKYHADKAFISAKSVNLKRGLTDVTSEEGESKKAMLASCSKAYLLLDHSKLDTNAFYTVCGLNDTMELITDHADTLKENQKQFLLDCDQLGVKVHIVD